MNRAAVTLTTALAPALWGTTYLTTTELLPAHHPLFTASMRSLPVGICMTLWLREIPHGAWWWRVGAVGMLNIGICFALLFIGVYRLPGGVAATIGAIQPLLVAGLGWPLLGLRPNGQILGAGLLGLLGVGMLVLGGAIHLDALGILAATGAAVSMAAGTVLTKRWGRPMGMSVLAFTGWQLVAGGLLLLPLMLAFEGPPRTFTVQNGAGYGYLCLIGTAFAYTVWFRGVGHLPASSVTFLNLLIPIVASIAGYIAYRQSFTVLQLAGIVLIAVSIISAQSLNRPAGRTAKRTGSPGAGYPGSAAS